MTDGGSGEDRRAGIAVLVRPLRIVNRRGLHARAAAKFVALAERRRPLAALGYVVASCAGAILGAALGIAIAT